MTAVAFLARAKPKHDIESLRRTADLANRLVGANGYGAAPAVIIETDDPDLLLTALRGLAQGTPTARPSAFLPIGGKRGLMVLALREMHAAAPAPVDVVALDKGAPFGSVKVAVDGCTLCLSCVSACPVSALGDNPDRPMLTFDESLCVQCGLCAATCPEKVITLEPRADFMAFGAKPVVIKQEEPACCTACGKAFGVKSTIDRVAAKLEGKHWMYSGANAGRGNVLYMCEDCRVGAMTKGSFDPYAGVPERAAAKTTEDYFREREEMERLRSANRDKSGSKD
jgi:ferredoxin